MPTWLLPGQEALALGLLEQGSEVPLSHLQHTLVPLQGFSFPIRYGHHSSFSLDMLGELGPSASLPLNDCVTLGHFFNHPVPQLSLLQK